MNAREILYFKDRQEWRRWLEENGNRAQEVWLLHYKKHSGKASLSIAEAVEEALCFGWIDGKLQSLDAEKFILRFTPRKVRSVWSRINRDRAEQLIVQGRMTAAGLAKIAEAKANGYWEKAYTNKTPDEIPRDLNQALQGNPVAWTNFNRFANSYRNMYIDWVNSARTETTRKKHITEVVHRSAANKKPGI